MTISIRLPDDAERKLAEAAKRLNVRVEDLAAAAARELVNPPAEAARALEPHRGRRGPPTAGNAASLHGFAPRPSSRTVRRRASW